MRKRSILFYVACALILVIVGRRANAQPFKPSFVDTVKIHDTLTVPVPLYQSRDTVTSVYIMSAKRGLSCAICHLIYQGFKQQTPKGLQWVQEPALVGIYNSRWKVIDPKKIKKIL